MEVETIKKRKNWLSKELCSLIDERHRVFNEWIKGPSPELFNSYKVLRNKVNRQLRKLLMIKQNNFSRISQLQKNNGGLSIEN